MDRQWNRVQDPLWKPGTIAAEKCDNFVYLSNLEEAETFVEEIGKLLDLTK